MTKASVLVIEDAAAIAAHIAGVLESLEYRVVGPAATGERAIELAHQERPDLALVDIRLAGTLDGIETAKELRQLFDLPVVFLTAHSDDQTLKRASSVRPSSYILKPFDERDLATQLDMALLKHQSEHTLDNSESPQENGPCDDDHARLVTVLEHLPVGVWMTDHEGRLLRKNAAADRLWGDEVPLPAYDAVSGQPLAAHEYPVARALASGEPVEPVELSIRQSDGKLGTVLVSAVPVRDKEGRISVVIGINFDITERKLAENLVRESEERLAVFAKELEDLVSERTHELLESQEQLRALAARLNWAEQRERKRLATELHDYLAQMLVLARLKLTQAKQESVTRAAELTRETDAIIGDCLAYTRTLIADLNPPALRQRGLAAGLLWLGDYMKKHDMSVAIMVPEGDVRLPEERAVVLFDCVRELLMNSWKHSGSREAAVAMTIEENAVRVEVRDQGRGFDIRATESSSALSSHYGLVSIRERVASLGGSVQIESVPGDGTRCLLFMPFDSPSPAMTRTRSRQGFAASHNGHPASTISILLVDDHTMIRQGLRATLESHADLLLIGEAADGEEAISLVDELRPTVVVMDMHLPRLNGVEATARIKARHAEVKVIGLTVSTDPEYQEAMMGAGADVVLTKEAAIEELCHAIRRAVAGSAASCA